MSRPTGLRTEVLTTVTLLMGAALLLGGVMMLRLTEQSLLEQKVEQLRLITGIIGRSLANSNDSQQGSPFNVDILKQLPEELRHQGWWLYNSDLLLLASFYTGGGGPVSIARRQHVRLSKEPSEIVNFSAMVQIFSNAEANALFLQPIQKKGRFIGLLEIRFSLDDIRYRLLLSQRMVLLYVLLYGAVLVFVGYYLLQRNIIKPARNLLQATEAVSRGELETRLPLDGPTEIAQLADAYNHMVEALQLSRQETERHIETLEATNRELQQARGELIRSEKLASVGQLAAGLAHELGNPLAALIGYLEVLKHRLREDNAEVVQFSLVEAERIDFLVRELLNFSRPGESDLEVIEAIEACRRSITLLVNQGSFGAVKYMDRLPNRLPPIHFNANKFQQLIINLLLNAIHACQDGGHVELRAGQEVDQIWLEIADAGSGISSENQNKVFDPFFTTKPPGEGTGLGLAICYRLVEEVGGNIFLESVEGKGTCFRLNFPILKKP